jgi:excisionase family DNA binding protein
MIGGIAMETLRGRSGHEVYVEFVLGDDTFRVEDGRLVPGPAWRPEQSARVLEELTRRVVRIVSEVVAHAELGERSANRATLQQVNTGAVTLQTARESTAALEGKLLLRVSEVAPMISVSRSKCYELIASGEIPSVMVGRSRRVVASELQAWIEQKLRDRS